MKTQFWSALTLGIASLVAVVGTQEASAQQRYVNYGPRCGLLRSDVRVRNNGWTGTSTFEKQNFKLDPESRRQNQREIDLTQKMRLNRVDCENFVINKVRVWAYRLSKNTRTEVTLALENVDSRGNDLDQVLVDTIEIPHSPSKTPKKQLFKLEEFLGGPHRLMRDFNTMKLYFDGDGDIRIDRIEVEWELAPLNFRLNPGFDYINGPIRDDAPIMIDSQTGNVVIVNGNNNTIVIGNNNVVGNGR